MGGSPIARADFVPRLCTTLSAMLNSAPRHLGSLAAVTNLYSVVMDSVCRQSFNHFHVPVQTDS